MKETPILFSTPMVQAILNGTKTQTRRIATPVKDDSFHGGFKFGAGKESEKEFCDKEYAKVTTAIAEINAAIDNTEVTLNTITKP